MRNACYFFRYQYSYARNVDNICKNWRANKLKFCIPISTPNFPISIFSKPSYPQYQHSSVQFSQP